MQNISYSNDLGFAVQELESLLNNDNSEFMLNTIRKYKQKRELEPYEINEIKSRLSKI